MYCLYLDDDNQPTFAPPTNIDPPTTTPDGDSYIYVECVECICGENAVLNFRTGECSPKVQNSKKQSPFDLSVFG